MSDASAFDDSLAPFSRSRRGFVMGEGAFVLWLTRGGRGVGPGEILGTAAASADCALNAWPPDPEPLVRTMSLALEDAGLARLGRGRGLCVGQCDRPSGRGRSTCARHALRRFAHHRDVDQGRDRRKRCVGRRRLRGGRALRCRRARAADCRLARTRIRSPPTAAGGCEHGRRRARSSWSTASRAAAPWSASSCGSPQQP